MSQISVNTVELVSSFTKPLVVAGTLQKSEHAALVKILKGHSSAMPNGAPIERGFCTIKEAAQALNLSTRTIRRMIQLGRLDAVQLNGSAKSLRIRIESLQALMDGKGVEK